MANVVIFSGSNGEMSKAKGHVDGLSPEDLEKGWKTFMDNNLDALRVACENPHPYVPD